MTLRAVWMLTIGSLPCISLMAAAGFAGPANDMKKAIEVADALDKIAQPRFLDFSNGRFGVDRLLRVAGHSGVRFQPLTTAEKSLYDRACAPQRDFYVLFMHCRHVPATAYYEAGIKEIPVEKRKKTDPIEEAETSRNRPVVPRLRYVDGRRFVQGTAGSGFAYASHKLAGWQQEVEKRLPGLMAGKPAAADAGEWTLVMRPVRAADDGCLKCHTESKRGDTLGALVYAVRTSAASIKDDRPER